MKLHASTWLAAVAIATTLPSHSFGQKAGGLSIGNNKPGGNSLPDIGAKPSNPNNNGNNSKPDNAKPNPKGSGPSTCCAQPSDTPLPDRLQGNKYKAVNQPLSKLSLGEVTSLIVTVPSLNPLSGKINGKGNAGGVGGGPNLSPGLGQGGNNGNFGYLSDGTPIHSLADLGINETDSTTSGFDNPIPSSDHAATQAWIPDEALLDPEASSGKEMEMEESEGWIFGEGGMEVDFPGTGGSESEEGEGVEKLEEEEEGMGEEATTRSLRGATTTTNDKSNNNKSLKSSSFKQHLSIQSRTTPRKLYGERATSTNVATYPIGLFHPLQCNIDANVDTAPCTTTFSQVLATTAIGSPVVIPCGECVTYDLDESTHSIAGLDVQGKLVIPPNHKSTLQTNYVFVQGILEMSDTNPISEDNISMRIILTGDASEAGSSEVTFTPADSNGVVYMGDGVTPGLASFSAGYKPFLVAGGQLRIKGWDGVSAEGSSAETWTPLVEMAEAPMPSPPLLAQVGDYQRAPLEPPMRLVPTVGEPEQCPRQLINHDFEVEVDHSVWSGGDGQIVHDVVPDEDGRGHVEIGPIVQDWQGFKLDFTDIAKECPLIEGATYLVTMRLRIDLEGIPKGTTMQCEIDGQECPRLRRRIMRDGQGDHWNDRWIQRGSIGKYGEWFWFSTMWTWSEAEGILGSGVQGSIFQLQNFPIGSMVSMDDFIFELPSEKSFQTPGPDSCSELIVNGNAEDNDGGGFSFYPFYSTDTGYYNPLILEEDNGQGGVNRFYRNRLRRGTTHMMRSNPNVDCFVKGYMYTVSIRARIHKYEPSAAHVANNPNGMKYYMRLIGPKSSGDTLYRNTIFCDYLTTEWQTCSGSLLIDEELESLESFYWEWRSQEEDTSNYAQIDLDDISISYKSGPAEGLKVSGTAAQRWGANSAIHITSTTLHWDDSQQAQITEVQDNADGSKTLKLAAGIDAVLSEKETPGMGAEVALLTRNIKIEGSAPTDTCGSDTIKQADYRGTIAQTESGRQCQMWTEQSPHHHSRTPENYPDAGLGAHNYCRNPDGEDRAWCYTTDSSKRWEYCDVPTCQGGYLQVLHTPNVTQTIEGVEFTNMGQLSNKNRFPVQFLYTRTAAGSSISRNAIRNSQQRCISMDGVSDATISSNVAHDTAGHCYYFGYEAKNNLVLNNLGSRTNPRYEHRELMLDGHDRDDNQATFFIRNPGNAYIGNVAAGSAGRGFEMDMHWATYGEDYSYRNNLILDTTSMRRTEVGAFRGNKAHSNYWQGFRLHHFEQFFQHKNEVDGEGVPVFEDTWAYRNREHGIYSYNVISPKWIGGNISDNQWGIVLRAGDRVLLQDFNIVGSSEVFKDHTVARSLKLCHTTSWTHEGIQMMSMLWRLGHTDPNLGLKMRNVEISGFDREKTWYPNCKTTEPIAFSSDKFDGQFDYVSSAQNVNIIDSRNTKIDLCRLQNEVGVTTAVITDMDGSLDPSGTHTGGSLVSNVDRMKDLAGAVCDVHAEQCMAYCPGVCLGTVMYKVEQFGTENWKLKVTDNVSGASTLMDPTIHVTHVEYESEAYSSRRFSASLPAGSYTAEFIDGEGNLAWPQYAEETWLAEPDCTGFATVGMVTLNKPPIVPGGGRKLQEQACHELIRNGGQGSLLTTEPWVHTMYRGGQPRDIMVGTGLGDAGSDAVCTYDRTDYYTGLGQNLDSRCLELMEGEYYEFSAMMKITAKKDANTIIQDIDPDRHWWDNKSPILTMSSRLYRDESTKEHIYTVEDFDRAYIARPYNPTGWNLLHGIIRIPSSFRSFFEIERSPSNQEYTIDSASFTKMECNRDELVLNGDLELENTKYWDTWGGTVKLDLVEGYKGTQGLKASNRGWWDQSQAQIVNLDCVGEGDRLAFSARFKFENPSGTTIECDPWTWWGTGRCANLNMHTDKGGHREYHRVGRVVSSEFEADGGWYHAHGLWTLNPNQAGAQYTKIYFDGMDPANSVIVDDVQIRALPYQCDALVENHDFADSTAFFFTHEQDRLKIDRFSPGADGELDYALRLYDRDWNSRGAGQKLDARCFVEGEKYTISAKFRMLNATGHGVDCDTNAQDNTANNCPPVVIQGRDGCATANGNLYWRFWNEIKTWDKDTFNPFENFFTVNNELASCGEVEVYLHAVHQDYDIIVDDLQISLYSTQAPTQKPTSGVTEPLTDEPTGSPTSSPTSMPTVSIITPLPLVESTPVEVSDGPHMLPRCSSLCVLTKALSNANGTLTNVAPVALSYDDGNWEKAAGEFAEVLLRGQEVGQYTEGSQIYLPALAEGGYYLTSYSHTVTEADKVARLLEAATFGTTAADIEAIGTSVPFTTERARQWIVDQMAVPLTSHREFFRRRTNPRLTHPVSIARSNHPCDGQSRWRNFAFSTKDGDLRWNPFQFEAAWTEGDPYISIKLNGHLRTVLRNTTVLEFTDSSDYQLEFNREYNMCHRPEEREGGRFWLRVNEETNECEELKNPLVHFYPNSPQPANVLSLPDVSPNVLEHIDTTRSDGGEYILWNGLNDDLCDSLNDFTRERDAPVFGKLPDGSWLQFDPRMKLEENTLDAHLPDGGGLTMYHTDGDTTCASAPRTFLNENKCTLSDSPSACSSASTPNLPIDLDHTNIVALHNITDQYVYAVVDLPLRDHMDKTQPSPCELGLRSRWEILDANQCTHSVTGKTNETLFTLLKEREVSDSNPFIRDIFFPITGMSCSADNATVVEAEIVIDAQCFRRVHPDHLSVYDFTYWTLEMTHPGNMVAMMENPPHPHPIKKWMDVEQSSILYYPAFTDETDFDTLAPHDIGRWDTYHSKFSYVGRFGDSVKFVDLPNEIRLDEVAEYFGKDTDSTGAGTMVCGSPYETANDPSLGQIFEVTHGRDTVWGLAEQREYTWTEIALTSPDQLRQRVAWALAQLLVIAQGAIGVQGSHTEVFLHYYDIFVRHAFGNYRDVLREISYSPIMAENLSFLQSKSAAYTWEHQSKISFADENFAREIMQLFSTGLDMLNDDGTKQVDENGNPILAYTNDEIMSFARVWTGFDYQAGRGNVEESSWSGNRHDPMKIQAGWRDKFPKTDMTGGYIGDGYPLCVDLPDKMFLRKGAEYRLIGSSHMPELMDDDQKFEDDSTLRKFLLHDNSLLKSTLCNKDVNGDCVWENTVILSQNLNCTAAECDADALRVVHVAEETATSPAIHYEYVRPPCVEQVFYADAKKVINKNRQLDSSCANPLLPYASEACCDHNADLTAERYIDYLYDQERVVYSTAGARCVEMGKQMCDFNYVEGIDDHKKGYHWTPDGCAIQVKVNAIGQVALVYEPETYAYLHPHVRNDNRNFFKVYWDGDYPKNDNEVSDGNTCGNDACQTLQTGGCLCDTEISESRVFRSMPSSVNEVLSKLTIGAYDPSAYTDAYVASVTENGVKAFFAVTNGVYDTKTVFEVVDEFGRVQRFKNTKEWVRISGASQFAFRNAPSFMSVLNTEADARDAYYETEAALDHYFHHPNTAPFIALRMIQRFTTSNPRPRYIKDVATAFRTGVYSGIGSEQYGDLAATIAAVLLHPEARSINLDADPFKGSLREPLLRMTALLRGMELKRAEGQPIVKLVDMDNRIGQMAHAFPTVFSFFLPEYSPGGRPGEASLVGPETMIMDMPKIVNLLNGMFSIVKYGLCRCHGGFGTDWTGCTEGQFSSATAYLSFTRPYDASTTSLDQQAENVIGELSTIMTSGRLNAENKEHIKDVYIAKLNDTDAADPAGNALRIAQQLILTTAEFHTTNVIAKSGELREEPEPPQATGAPYKAIVYIMFGGGADSYNMLVPHTCSQKSPLTNMTLWEEYNDIRQEIALQKEQLNVLNNVVNQGCETFGVHPELNTVQTLFNEGDLLFFANTGVLTKETDKENYWRDTETQLFAHNFMQEAAQRIDPLKAEDGTGILGRMRDVLTKQGLSVGAFSLNVNSVSLIGEPGVTASPMILSGSGISAFNQGASSPDMDVSIALLNGATKSESGVFGEWYSDSLTKSLSHNQLLYDTLAGKETLTTFPDRSHLGNQLEMVSKMIDSRLERGTDADMFFLSTGGWDTHSQVLMNQERLFADVDASLKAFSDEMKAKGVWDSVTVIETSDFARTLTQNGNLGSDHAWGGNYIMMGGSVLGGQIVGEYPSIKDGTPLNIGRGRIIPTTSWEAVFLPLAEWAGVNPTEFDYICPNKGNFLPEHFFAMGDLFESTPL